MRSHLPDGPLLDQARFPAANKNLAECAANEDYGDDYQPDTGLEFGALKKSMWRSGAIAASIMAVGLIATQLVPFGDSIYSFQTEPGNRQTIALADGSEIMLHGGT